MAFVHDYLRGIRDAHRNQLAAFASGRLQLLDTSVNPPKDLSKSTMSTLRLQLEEVEALMAEHGGNELDALRSSDASRHE